MIDTRISDSGSAHELRALIVGLGSIGQRHARNLRSLLGGRVTLSAYRVQRSARGLSDGLREDSDVIRRQSGRDRRVSG